MKTIWLAAATGALLASAAMAQAPVTRPVTSPVETPPAQAQKSGTTAPEFKYPG